MDEPMSNFLGVKLPIIQAPMAGVQGSDLTIAVCKAGGLGSLPCAMLSPEMIVSEIKAIKAAVSSPFNLNFFCHQMPDYSQVRHDQWQRVLKPYFDELTISCKNQPYAASRQPFNHLIADLIEPFKPEVVSFHFGLPDDELLSRVKGWGTKVLSSATTVKEALWLEAKGVDAVIAQGVEAGGHRGMFLTDDVTTQLGLFSLLPQLTARLNIPVIAAGGIANPRGVASALSMGASAVQIGTTYLLCPEANTTPLHRNALKSEAAQHTALTNIFSGRPARGIVNRVMRELGYITPDAPSFPYAGIEITQLKLAAEAVNSTDFTSLWCGQNASGCQEISAYELTRWLTGAA